MKQLHSSSTEVNILTGASGLQIELTNAGKFPSDQSTHNPSQRVPTQTYEFHIPSETIDMQFQKLLVHFSI